MKLLVDLGLGLMFSAVFVTICYGIGLLIGNILGIEDQGIYIPIGIGVCSILTVVILYTLVNLIRKPFND